MKDKAIPRISSVHHINLLSYETSISCSSLLVFHSLNSFFLFLFSCQALFYHYFCFPAWRDVVWKQRATDHSCAKCICETLLLKVIQEVKMILCNSLFLCHPSFCCDSKLISHRFVSWLFYVHFTCTSVQSSFSFSIREKKTNHDFPLHQRTTVNFPSSCIFDRILTRNDSLVGVIIEDEIEPGNQMP